MFAARLALLLGACAAVALILATAFSVSEPSLLDENVASDSAANAEALRRQARAAETAVQKDTLRLSLEKTSLSRLNRKLRAERRSSNAESDTSSLMSAAERAVQKDKMELGELEDQAKNSAPHEAQAKERVARAKQSIASALKEIKDQKHERAQLLAKAHKLELQTQMAQKQQKSLQERSDRAFNRAMKPNSVGFNHYSDYGADLMNQAKATKREVDKLASQADSARIDASLVGGVHGTKAVKAALHRDRQYLKMNQRMYDKLVVRNGNVLEKIAAMKTRLSAARMQAASYEREDSAAEKAVSSTHSSEEKLRRQIQKVKDTITQLESDEKAKARLHHMLLRKAKVEERMAQKQFQAAETDN